MILKTSKAFKPKTFARRTGTKTLQLVYENFGLDKINDLEHFEDEFSERYEKCPDEIKSYFNLINDVACDKARPDLIRCANSLDIEHKELDIFELACLVFIKNDKAIYDIFQWLNIDNIDNFREFDGDSQKEPIENKLAEFTQALSAFFPTEGMGKQVEIDIYRKPNKIAYIINHGGYIKNEYIANDESKKFETVKQRKANAITLVYIPKLARLRIKCRNFKVIQEIKNNFAKFLLDDENFFDNAENKQYFDLDKLLSMRKDDFTTPPEYSIKDVDFVKIEGHLYNDETLDNALKSRKGLLNSLGADEFENRISNLTPQRIHLQFRFEGGKGNKRTIQFAEPNFTNFNTSVKDGMIEECLREWEIIN